MRRFSDLRRRYLRAGLALLPAIPIAFIGYCGSLAANLTTSMPSNVYLVLDPFPKLAGLAAAFSPPRGFNPELAFIKRIAGVPGDVVGVDEATREVSINGEVVAWAKPFTSGGDRLDMIEPGVIPPDHFFMLGDLDPSFDSRFAWVGLIHRDRIYGAGFGVPFAPSARKSDYETEGDDA